MSPTNKLGGKKQSEDDTGKNKLGLGLHPMSKSNQPP